MRLRGTIVEVGAVRPGEPTFAGIIVRLDQHVVRQLAHWINGEVEFDARPPLTSDCVSVFKTLTLAWSSTPEIEHRVRRDIGLYCDAGDALLRLHRRGFVDRRLASPDAAPQWRRSPKSEVEP